jgi:hypothetical protein
MAVTRQVGSQTDAKPSAVDLTGKEFRFAKRVNDGGESKFSLAAAGEQVAGVISEGKAVGLHTSVDTGNQLKVVAGAAVNPGQFVASDADGAARVATSGQVIAGQAINRAARDELLELDMTKVGAGTAA